MKAALQTMFVLILWAQPAKAQEPQPFDPNQYILESEIDKAVAAAAQRLELGFVEFHGRPFVALNTFHGSMIVAFPSHFTPEELGRGHCVGESIYRQLKPNLQTIDPAPYHRLALQYKNRILTAVQRTCAPGQETRPATVAAESSRN